MVQGLFEDFLLLSFYKASTRFRKNLNASKPSEHPPQVEDYLI